MGICQLYQRVKQDGGGDPGPFACVSLQDVVWARGFLRRAEGFLLGRDREKLLVLAPCKDVHTFGMRWRLDIAFVARDGTVLEAHSDVLPGRRLHNARAVAVVERISDGSPWASPGDVICLHVQAEK